MEEFGIGAGLAAIGFWGFIAAAVFATYWDAGKKRESQQETLRRVIESGQEIDEELVNKMLSINQDGSGGRLDQSFKITALWVLPVSPGVAILGYALSFQAPEAFAPLMGVAALLACLGIGFWVAGKIVERWYSPEQNSNSR